MLDEQQFLHRVKWAVVRKPASAEEHLPIIADFSAMRTGNVVSIQPIKYGIDELISPAFLDPHRLEHRFEDLFIRAIEVDAGSVSLRFHPHFPGIELKNVFSPF